MSTEVILGLMSALIAGTVSLLTTYATTKMNYEALRREYQLTDATQRVIRRLLSDSRFKKRKFSTIQHHLRGFSDDVLRQHLVSAGAVAFTNKTSGDELWGLIELVEDEVFPKSQAQKQG